MTNLFGSICLSDIPAELIRTNENNGKKYISVIVKERREPSKYGHTHYIKVYAKRGEIGEGVNLYIGELKESQFNDAPAEQKPSQPAPQQNNDGLPF